MLELIQQNELLGKGLGLMSISRLVKKGVLGNVGYGYYVRNPNTLKLERDNTMSIINGLLDDYPIVPNRTVFSSISLNFCINQLISSTTYIVEVEKEYLQSVFELIKKNVENAVLFRPTEADKLNYWRPGAIYLTELFKRSPVHKDGTIAIEKLIVDLLFDDTFYSLYSGQDIKSAIDILCSKYLINYKTLLSYASRKNRKKQLLSEIGSYIPKQVLEAIGRD